MSCNSHKSTRRITDKKLKSKDLNILAIILFDELLFWCIFSSGGTCITATDYPGSDISQTPQTTISALNCQILCQNFPGCQYFTFINVGGKCSLKYQKTSEISSSTGLSGPAFCSAGQGKWMNFWLFTPKFKLF